MKTEIKLGTLCNNNCIFCLNEERCSSIDLEDLAKDAETALKNKINEVWLTGGEPTIHKQFISLLSILKSNNFKINIQTNGRSFYYLEYARKICSFGIGHFLISFHAHNKEFNREITGSEESYEQTKQGIQNLIKLKQNVSVNIVVNKLNFQHLNKIAEHHKKLGVSLIQFSWVRPQGKVKNQIYNLIPKYKDAIPKLAKALDILERENAAVLGVPFCVIDKKYWKNLGNAYENSFMLYNTEIKNAKEWFFNARKMFDRKCFLCEKQKECYGIFKRYAYSYGTSEFMPSIDKEKLSDLLKMKTEELKLIKKGFFGDSFIIKSEEKQFFMKIYNFRYPKERYLEMSKFRDSLGDFALKPAKTIVDENMIIEIYEFLKKSETITSEETIKDVIKKVSEIYKTEKQEPKEEFKQTIEINLAFLRGRKEETEKLKTLKNNLDKLTFSKLHGDLKVHNMVISGGKLKFLIDFDKAFYGPSIYDVAEFCTSLNENGIEVSEEDIFKEFSDYLRLNKYDEEMLKNIMLLQKINLERQNQGFFQKE